jgi:FlaA1/EpsC-like NDP-sugar epimerase
MIRDYLLLVLPRAVKRLVVVLVDFLISLIAVWGAFNLRFDTFTEWSTAHTVAYLLSIFSLFLVFNFFKIYNNIFRYSGYSTLIDLSASVIVYAIIYTFIISFTGLIGVPRSIGVLQPVLLLVGLLFSRIFMKYWLGVDSSRRKDNRSQRVLIYGAGSAGRQLAGALKASAEIDVVGFIDDDSRLHGQVLNGLKIYSRESLLGIVGKFSVTQVYLALPSISRHERNKILEYIRSAQVQVRTLPGLMDLAQGRVHVSDLKELEIEDLLGRDVVMPDRAMLDKNITGKVVLVTGAGGSIGSELCRQIINMSPSVLLMVEITEFALYQIELELQKHLHDFNTRVQLISLIANVRDNSRMDEILNTWKPHTIYHAAAYKHVPLVEHNSAEGVKNNVIGTLNLAMLAEANGVSNFVLISTDKAVRPTNIMGASKRLAEMILQARADLISKVGGKTCFSMVRFGNVLGSSGSVVPLFREQIKYGGPITLTDERITRYFMSIPEAAQLVIQASSMATGGDLFVLDMGEPVRIFDLAKRMVELSGLTIRDENNTYGDIEVQITGLRPGEKLYEELLIGDDPMPTSHARIMKAREDFLYWDILKDKIDALSVVLEANDVQLICDHLKCLVSGYRSQGEVVDYVWVERNKYEIN